MHGLDWDDVRYFLEVVRNGSLARAAQRLNVNQTTVSRRISALEKRLEKALFDRSGGHWIMTPMGERLVAAAQRMAEQADSIERQVMADSQELSGTLRVTVADVCIQTLVLPALERFTAAYPDVDIELIATRNLLDLAAREADVALRSTDEPPPELVGRRIGQLAYAVYGSREMFERVVQNGDQADIPCITWLGDGETVAPWVARSFPDARRVHRTSELGLMLEMVRRGIGIAQMPCVLVEPDPALRRIPVEYVEPGWGLWVLTHTDLRTTARVRVFRDILVEELEARKAQIEGR